jgi:hypothetical protein
MAADEDNPVQEVSSVQERIYLMLNVREVIISKQVWKIPELRRKPTKGGYKYR